MTATFFINRVPSSVLNGKSSFEVIYGKSPNLHFLRTFGCLCFTTRVNNTDKFSSRAEKCVFIGYSNQKKGYKVLSLDNNIVFFSRDVKFYETIFPFQMSSSTKGEKHMFNNNDKPVYISGINHENFFDEIYQTGSEKFVQQPNDDNGGVDGLNWSHGLDGGLNLGPSNNNRGQNSATAPVPLAETHDNEMVSEGNLRNESGGEPSSESLVSVESPSVSKRPERTRTMPVKFSDYVVEGKHKFGIEKFVGYSRLGLDSVCYSSSLNKSVEPTSFDEAVKDPHWVHAMNEEIDALNRNGTWVLVDLPKGRKPIGCRWVYKIKYKSDGQIERFKARLVAKGYSQKEGVDFDETFSPVVKRVTIRTVITFAYTSNWKIYQLDVNNAFLYGTIKEDVYMTLPQGYFSKNDHQVCKLVKSLYGLKQAPRQWNEKLTLSLTQFGFIQSVNNFSLFFKHCGSSCVILLVYVDDIVLTGSSISEVDKVKLFLKSQFLIKDLGELKFFLGIEIVETNEGLCLSQRKYCLDLLHEYGLLSSKPINTPLDMNVIVTSEGVNDKDELIENITEYQKVVGKLIYLTNTRPHISYTVQILSRFMHAPRMSHFKLDFPVLRYLKGVPGFGVLIPKGNNLTLSAWSDADWGKCLDTRRSVTGYAIFLGKSLISWKSKRQTKVSKSSCEAEYRALSSTTCELLLILKVMRELCIEVVL